MQEELLKKLRATIELKNAGLIEKAEAARKIIISDFSIYDTVEEISRKVGLSEQKLQHTFKQLHGTTVGKFSREERLKWAHEILITGNDILLSVAMSAGYNDVSNFSTAFKQYFGYPPGHINKLKRKYESLCSQDVVENT